MNVVMGSPFPNKDQELLLKAALLKGNEAFEAWQKWKNNSDLDGYLDQGSFRILPLLYKNLLNQQFEDPLMNKLKGIYRHSWYTNQKLFHKAGQVIEFFERSGIRTLVLKGAALSKLFYKDSGARPMSDIDILVPASEARLTIELLKDTGWKPEFEEYIEYNLRYGRSMQFTDNSGFELDLHWHPFFESHRNTCEEHFWDEAVPLQIGEFSTLALCPTDTLLHAIVHGMNWNEEPPIRWIADSYVIIDNPEIHIDWNGFLKDIRNFKIVIQCREALNYLKNTFKLPAPDFVITTINKLRTTRADSMVYSYNMTNPEEIPGTLFGKLKELFIVYLRQTGRKQFFSQVLGFIGYLRFRTKGKKYIPILWYYFKKDLLKK